MSKYVGKHISLTVYGQSHDESIGVVCEGFPKIKVDTDNVYSYLRKRIPHYPGATTRVEQDIPEYVGLKNGSIDGTFSVVLHNRDVRPQDYSALYGIPRPGHADLGAYYKDGTTDFTGGGRFSGRLTAPTCIAGAIAKQYLVTKGIKIVAYVSSVGNVKGKSYLNTPITEKDIADRDVGAFPSLSQKDKMMSAISNAQAEGDSIGGVVECIVFGMPRGVGNDTFDGLESKLSSLIYSIPAVKGVEFGRGFAMSDMKGSESNDQYTYQGDNIALLSNNMGGILGGISTGEPICIRVAVKPTPSISKVQRSVDLINKRNVDISITGRHDACIAPRAVMPIESVVALGIMDEVMQ